MKDNDIRVELTLPQYVKLSKVPQTSQELDTIIIEELYTHKQLQTHYKSEVLQLYSFVTDKKEQGYYLKKLAWSFSSGVSKFVFLYARTVA